METEYDFFVSHNGTIKKFVGRLVDKLIANNILVFLDKNNIILSDDNTSSLEKGIKESSYFMCVLSEGYYKSKWCMWELNMAISLNKEVVPIFLDHPPSMSIDLLKDRSGIHASLFERESDLISRIIDKLKELMENSYKNLSIQLSSMSIKNPDKDTIIIKKNIHGDNEMIIIDETKFPITISDAIESVNNILESSDKLYSSEMDSEFEKILNIFNPMCIIIYVSSIKKLKFNCSKITKSMTYAIRKVFNVVSETFSRNVNYEKLIVIYLTLIPLYYLSNRRKIKDILNMVYTLDDIKEDSLFTKFHRKHGPTPAASFARHEKTITNGSEQIYDVDNPEARQIEKDSNDHKVELFNIETDVKISDDSKSVINSSEVRSLTKRSSSSKSSRRKSNYRKSTISSKKKKKKQDENLQDN